MVNARRVFINRDVSMQRSCWRGFLVNKGQLSPVPGVILSSKDGCTLHDSDESRMQFVVHSLAVEKSSCMALRL